MPGRMEFGFTFGQPQPAARRAADDPFKVLILGDFSGRASRGIQKAGELARRPVLAIDVDNFEQVLERLRPTLQLSLGENAGEVEISPTELEDFHPDSLYRKLELFQKLRDLRKRLQDPATFSAAAAELGGLALEPTEPPAAPATDSPPADEPADSGGNFASLLGKSAGDDPKVRVGGQQVDINQLIKNIMEPHVTPSADPRKEELVASVDSAISDEMRTILHAADFQALESNWQSLRWLLGNVEMDEELQLHLLDVSRDELAVDIAAAGQTLDSSQIYQRIIEQYVDAPDGQPWAVVAGLYEFGTSEDDLNLLAALGLIAARAGGTLLSAATPNWLGVERLEDNPNPKSWTLEAEAEERVTAIRKSDAARSIGLALPRLLARLPYGEKTDAIDSFNFEELLLAGDRDGLCWSNPAWGAVMLLARSFKHHGWSMQPGAFLDVDDLPAYTYREDGETRMQACGEVYMSERTGEAVLERGLMPLLSYRDRPTARLLRFQTLADPSTPLPGPWG